MGVGDPWSEGDGGLGYRRSFRQMCKGSNLRKVPKEVRVVVEPGKTDRTSGKGSTVARS